MYSKILGLIVVAILTIVGCGGNSSDTSTGETSTGEISKLEKVSLDTFENMFSIVDACYLNNDALVYIVHDTDLNNSRVDVKEANGNIHNITTRFLWGIKNLQCSNDGSMFTFNGTGGSRSGNFKLYNTSNYEDVTTTILEDLDLMVYQARFTNNNQNMIILCDHEYRMISGEKELLIYNIKTKSITKTYHIENLNLNNPGSNIIGISSDDKMVALTSGYADDKLIVVNINTDEITDIDTTSMSGVYSPVFFDNNSKVAIGNINGKIYTIDLNDTTNISTVDTGLTHYLYSLKNIDDNLLVFGGYNGIVKLFDLNTFTELASYDTGHITTIKLKNHSELIISVGAGHGGKIYILKITS